MALFSRHCHDSCLRPVHIWQSAPATCHPPFSHQMPSAFPSIPNPLTSHITCFPFPCQLTPYTPACSTCSLPDCQVLHVPCGLVSCQPLRHMFCQVFVPVTCTLFLCLPASKSFSPVHENLVTASICLPACLPA